MISPTVYIGLGTSGTEIIHGVRKHIYEEYGVPSLPCLQFISIETDATVKATDLYVAPVDEQAPWQRIRPVDLGVSSDDFPSLKQKLDESSGEYHPGWAEWLDPAILERATYDAGAKLRRMAGRMCLWYHWSKVAETLTQAVQMAVEKQDETREYLQKYFTNRNQLDGYQALLADNQANELHVYICGSLCGGTCSGAFWELAYLVREIANNVGQGLNLHLEGFFTVVDRDIANKDHKTMQRFAVNCWAALLEYDYWARGSGYQIRNPAQGDTWFPQVPNTAAPLSAINVVSLSNDRGVRQVGRRDGKLDFTALHTAIATAVYLDLVPEVRNHKRGLRQNYEAEKLDVHKVYCQRFQTFGLSGFYYPKFAIASASACLLGKELLGTWLEPGDETRARAEAFKDWNIIHQKIRKRIKHVSGNDITESILADLDAALKNPDGRIEDIVQTKLTASKLPDSPVLWNALQPDGALYRELSRRFEDIVRDALAWIQERTDLHVNEIVDGEWKTLKEVQTYVAELPNAVRKHAEERSIEPLRWPWDEWSKIEKRYAEVKDDGVLGFYFAKKPILAFYLQAAKHEVRRKIALQVESVIEKVLARVCASIHRHLERESDKFADAGPKERIAKIVNAVETAAKHLESSHRNLVAVRPEGALKALTLSGLDGVKGDAKRVSRIVRHDTLETPEQIRIVAADILQKAGKARLMDFLRRGPEHIRVAAWQYFLDRSHRRVERVQFLPNVTNQSDDTILAAAKGSFPALQFNGAQTPNRGLALPDMLIGPRNSEHELRNIFRNINRSDSFPQFKEIGASIDNMVVFYSEAAAIALSDWSIESRLETLLDQRLTSRDGGLEQDGQEGNRYAYPFSHKDGHFRYHPKLRKLGTELAFWAEICDYFRDDLVASEILRHGGPSLDYHFYTRAGVKDDVNLRSAEALRRFGHVDGGQPARDFVAVIRDFLKQLGHARVVETMNNHRDTAETREQQQHITKLNVRLVDTLWPNSAARGFHIATSQPEGQASPLG